MNAQIRTLSSSDNCSDQNSEQCGCLDDQIRSPNIPSLNKHLYKSLVLNMSLHLRFLCVSKSPQSPKGLLHNFFWIFIGEVDLSDLPLTIFQGH